MARIACAIAVGIALLTLVTPASAAPPILDALSECPKDGPNRACLLNEVAPLLSPGCEEDCPHYPHPAILDVSGKLNGGIAKRYRLRLTRPEGYALPTQAPPEIAYLGYSSDRHPIVLTNEGPLEIRTKGFGVSVLGQTFIDERTWKKLDMAFIQSNSGHIVVTSPTDIGVWDRVRDICITALVSYRERLRVIEGGCSARPAPPVVVAEAVPPVPLKIQILRKVTYTLRAWATGLTYDQIADINTPGSRPSTPVWQSRWDVGNVVPAKLSLARVRKLFPYYVHDDMGTDDVIASHFGGSGSSIHIDRIKDSPILIFITSHDDC